MTTKPNLFDHARSELCQDAFLAWMCEWADPRHATTDPALHGFGQAFIAFLYQKHGTNPPRYQKVEVSTQDRNIDVLVKLISADAPDHYILIEDKVYAGVHGEQLEKYMERLRVDHPGAVVIPIYLKTWFMGQVLKNKEFVPIDMSSLASFLERTEWLTLNNAIFLDFKDAIINRQSYCQQFVSTPMADWEIDHWFGFFDALRARLDHVTYETAYSHIMNPKGGLYACWMGGVEVSPEHNLYLQIDSEPRHQLTFRVSNPKTFRTDLYTLLEELTAIGNEFGLELAKPARLSTKGETERVAELRSPFFSPANNGLVDMDHVERMIHKCQAVTERYQKTLNKEGELPTIATPSL